jgi:hypothetical protein
VFCALSNGASGMRVEPADSFGSVAAWVAAVSWGVRCLAADEVDERACGGWGGALAAPDERYGETNGGVQAAYFEGRPVEGSDRPGEDRGGEAAGGERSQKEGRREPGEQPAAPGVARQDRAHRSVQTSSRATRQLVLTKSPLIAAVRDRRGRAYGEATHRCPSTSLRAGRRFESTRRQWAARHGRRHWGPS